MTVTETFREVVLLQYLANVTLVMTLEITEATVVIFIMEPINRVLLSVCRAFVCV